MTYAILALFAAAFFFPPVFRGEKAQHNPLGIWKPEGPISPAGSVTEYAHVQEKGEYRLAKLGALVAGVPFLFVQIEPLMLAIMAQVIVMLLADQAVRFFPGVDWAGHGAEIMAAEADGAIGYREAEIKRMARSYDKPRDREAVIAGLTRWEWLARIVWRLGR